MNFEFSEDQRLLQTASRDFLERQDTLRANRTVLESESECMSSSLWQGAAEMGWLGLVIPEALGGAGFGYLELALVAEEVGRSLAPIPFGSQQAVCEALLVGANAEQQARHLPAIAAGEIVGTLAMAEGRGVVRADNLATTYSNGTVSGNKVAVGDGNSATHAIVLCDSTQGPALALVELDTAGVTRISSESIDPTRSCASYQFENARAELIGEAGRGWDLLQQTLDRIAVIEAFEQVGGAQRAMEMTKTQIMDRYAFGRPIASFQAIKHRMAQLYAAIELARSNCYFGAWALENNSPELPLAAAAARISASSAFELASTEMIQMHGGVGFTWEYDCHMFYRRARHLGLNLGAAGEWRDKLVDRLVAQQAA